MYQNNSLRLYLHSFHKKKNALKQSSLQNDILHEEYIFARKNGINKKLYFKIVNGIRNKRGINNLRAYIFGAIKNVINRISFRNGTRKYDNPIIQFFYNWLNDTEQ